MIASRPEISEEIGTARAHGDLKENAEYHAAKEKQGLVEAKIKDIEGRIAEANVIDPAKLNSNGKVVFGFTVELKDYEDDSLKQYTIVGETEADLTQGKISVTTPIAKGLIGKNEGDDVKIHTPGGEREYEIVRVFYQE